MRQRRLFDGKKRPYFIAARADNADRACHDQKKKVLGRSKGQAGTGHQNGPDNQHALSPDAVGSRREQQRNRDVARERQRQKHPHLSLI
jgi:hypothetical protein